MNKNEIITTAFRVWGRDFYRNPSLSTLAKELKVSKPALYRHFLSKEAINNAMLEHFINELAAFIRPGMEKAAKTSDSGKALYCIIEAFGSFFGKNCYALIYSLININDHSIDSRTISGQISAKGIDIKIIKEILEKKYDITSEVIHLIFATLTFYMANFHKANNCMDTLPKEDQINDIIRVINKVINSGLGYSPVNTVIPDIKLIKKIDENSLINDKTEPAHPMDALFKAVAEAVAEAGPWNASMEMVAKKMGLSKSSLYGHFKNKKDMIKRLFITEFKRIIDFAHHGMGLSQDKHEKLYLGIYSIAVYLKSRPEILVTINWIRTRKLELGKHHTGGTDKKAEIFNIFKDINLDSDTSYWILFLLVNVLIHSDIKKEKSELEINKINILYRFITLGLGGFVK